MKPIFRVAVIEVTRLLALVAGATSAFLLTAFSISLLNIPYSLIYGPLPFEEWQLSRARYMERTCIGGAGSTVTRLPTGFCIFNATGALA